MIMEVIGVKAGFDPTTEVSYKSSNSRTTSGVKNQGGTIISPLFSNPTVSKKLRLKLLIKNSYWFLEPNIGNVFHLHKKPWNTNKTINTKVKEWLLGWDIYDNWLMLLVWVSTILVDFIIRCSHHSRTSKNGLFQIMHHHVALMSKINAQYPIKLINSNPPKIHRYLNDHFLISKPIQLARWNPNNAHKSFFR